MARRYDFFSMENNISSSHHVMFFLLYGQKSQQANREHINTTQKNTPVFSIYFLLMSLNSEVGMVTRNVMIG